MIKTLTEKHKQKIGLANQRIIGEKIKNGTFVSPMKGKTHSILVRQLLSNLYKGKLKIQINKEELYELYILSKWTALQCAKHFKCSESCVVDRLKLYGIKQRSKSEAKFKELNPMHNKKPHNFGKTMDDYEPQKRCTEKQRITIKELYARGLIQHPTKGKTLEEAYGNERAKQIRKNLSESHFGDWPFKPYTLDFNKRFKESIRERDNHSCILCNKMEEEELKERNSILHVHHIDYDKANSFPQNCLSLCHRCHNITNFNRNHWKGFFQALLKERYHYEYTIDQKIILDFTKGVF